MKIKIIFFILNFVNIAYGMDLSYFRLSRLINHSSSKYKNLEACDYEIKAKDLGKIPWSLQALSLIKVAKAYNGKGEAELPYLFKEKITLLRWYLSRLKGSLVGDELNNHFVPSVDLIESVLALTPTPKFNETIRDLAVCSASNCNIEAMTFFLERGLQINKSLTRNFKILPLFCSSLPLNIVCSSRCNSITKIEAIQFLIKKGADINVLDEGETPLINAIRNAAFFPEGSIEIIEYLLELGADINKANYQFLPLTLAVFEKDINLISFLLAHGADASLRDPFNESALDHAYQDKNAKIIELLENHLKKQEVIDAKSKE